MYTYWTCMASCWRWPAMKTRRMITGNDFFTALFGQYLEFGSSAGWVGLFDPPWIEQTVTVPTGRTDGIGRRTHRRDSQCSYLSHCVPGRRRSTIVSGEVPGLRDQRNWWVDEADPPYANSAQNRSPARTPQKKARAGQDARPAQQGSDGLFSPAHPSASRSPPIDPPRARWGGGYGQGVPVSGAHGLVKP